MREDEIPPAIQLVLEVGPMIAKHERRMRRWDWVMPFVSLGLIVLFCTWPPSVWVTVSCAMLGGGIGAVVTSAIFRRRAYARLKESTEHLSLEVAMRLEHDDD